MAAATAAVNVAAANVAVADVADVAAEAVCCENKIYCQYNG